MLKLFQVSALLYALLLLSGAEARRIRVRPQRPVVEEEPSDQEEQPQRVEYYAAESQEAQPPQQKLVLVAPEGEVFNGLYGRAVAREGTEPQYSRVIQRPLVAQRPATRVKEAAREPPVQTIRNYSKVNDDGSFTFGYEAADGSFKEETRGTDCVVRGKYGYVDPDGNKREFTYVSGNPCDPNAPQEEEEEKEEADDSGEENVPQIQPNIPRRPLRPIRPVKPLGRPTTTLFQQNFNTGAVEAQAVQETPQHQPQIYLQPAPVAAAVPAAAPAVEAAAPAPVPVAAPVRARVPSRTASVHLPVPAEKPEPVVRVTPRPITPSTPSTLPATTYRPQLLVSVTPRPNVVLTKHSTLAHPSAAPSASPLGTVDFEEELKRFQLENNVVTTPKALSPGTTLKADPHAVQPGQPIYTSELVFDPTTGQYNTVVYQQIPKATADLSLKTRLPQLVQPVQQVQPVAPVQPAPVVKTQPSNLLQQQLFDQQKQVLFQQSADLYNQQTQQLQAQQLQAQQHRFQPAFSPTTLQYQPVSSTLAPAAAKPLSTAPQKFKTPEVPRLVSRPSNRHQYYYFAPQLDAQAQSIATGQLDAFLRGHNYQF